MPLSKVNLHYFQKRQARALSLYIHKEKLLRNYIEKRKSTLSYIRTSNFRVWLSAVFFLFTWIPHKKFPALLSGAATARKVSKYGVISGQYFPVFSPNTGKYGPEITPYLDTIQAMPSIDSHDSLKNYV